MQGLFEKDIRIILRNKQFVIIVAFMAFFFSFDGKLDMILPYMAVFGTIFSISTINYDEMDKGYTYIMTLPVTYKDYVFEKYIFCTAGGLATGLFTLVIFILAVVVKGGAINVNDLLTGVAVIVPMIVIMESLFIPLQLKFGNSKSRIFLMIFIGIIVSGAYALDQFVGDLGQLAATAIQAFENMPAATVIAVVCAVTVIILAVSLLCSIKVMEKKQY